jgi:hypothetical protein
VKQTACSFPEQSGVAQPDDLDGEGDLLGMIFISNLINESN